MTEKLDCPGPASRNDGRDDEALAGVTDSMLEQLCKRQTAKALGYLDPGIDCTRHRDSLPTALGEGLTVSKALGTPGGWRAAAAVEAVQVAVVGDDGKRITANAVHIRLYYG